jgi:hypothetical protein
MGAAKTVVDMDREVRRIATGRVRVQCRRREGHHRHILVKRAQTWITQIDGHPREEDPRGCAGDLPKP